VVVWCLPVVRKSGMPFLLRHCCLALAIFIASGITLSVVGADSPAPNESDADVTTSELSLPPAVWQDNSRVRKVLEPTKDFSLAEPFELMQGGAGTQSTHIDRNAYSQETSTLSFERLQTFKLGNAMFNKFWVASPSSTQASDGLGPFFNARACQSCHIKDGRGQLPVSGEKTASLVLQLKNRQGAQWVGDPVYGSQFHTSAVPGVKAEGQVVIDTEPLIRTFADGTTHELQKPIYKLQELAYGELDPNTRVSPRLAPAVIGLGLLAAIDSTHILAYADPDDSNGDGISGRANFQQIADGKKALGRFGHKAAMSSTHEQNVHALFTDMGLSSAGKSLDNPQGDCTRAQTICQSLGHGDQPRLGKGEAPDQVVDLITFYTQNLAVPARRNVSESAVLKGKSLFYGSGCSGCHVPKHVTLRETKQKELQFQLIWPYTDLLLHDMGDELADHAGEGEANGREWRTAPLWGVGLAKTVNPNTSFLHDGRAKTLLDAVLWHGGEAQGALNKVLVMNNEDRKALIAFLESL
jgi:CxxC motif-containing protein (DUF1111 family)